MGAAHGGGDLRPESVALHAAPSPQAWSTCSSSTHPKSARRSYVISGPGRRPASSRMTFVGLISPPSRAGWACCPAVLPASLGLSRAIGGERPIGAISLA